MNYASHRCGVNVDKEHTWTLYKQKGGRARYVCHNDTPQRGCGALTGWEPIPDYVPKVTGYSIQPHPGGALVYLGDKKEAEEEKKLMEAIYQFVDGYRKGGAGITTCWEAINAARRDDLFRAAKYRGLAVTAKMKKAEVIDVLTRDDSYT